MTRWIAIVTVLSTLVLSACGGATTTPAPTWPNTLTKVTPLEGTSAGGTQVTLRGTGFTDPTFELQRILFGEEPAESWEIVDDTTIRCVAPPGALGSTVITLWGDDEETPLLTGGFRYVALTLYVADGAASTQPNLYRVDLDTGRPILVGSIGYPIAALATRPDGVIFAVEDGALRRLIRIDPSSGAGRPVALLRDQAGGIPDLVDVTFVGNRLIGQTPAGHLVEIDLGIGTVSLLDPSPQPGIGSGVASQADGTVVLTPDPGEPIYTYDPDTGESTEGPPLEVDAPEAFEAIAVLDDFVYGVRVDPDGIEPPLLVRMNPYTGEVEVLGPLPPDVASVTNDF